MNDDTQHPDRWRNAGGFFSGSDNLLPFSFPAGYGY
jgi:hypothetical protein